MARCEVGVDGAAETGVIGWVGDGEHGKLRPRRDEREGVV